MLFSPIAGGAKNIFLRLHKNHALKAKNKAIIIGSSKGANCLRFYQALRKFPAFCMLCLCLTGMNDAAQLHNDPKKKELLVCILKAPAWLCTKDWHRTQSAALR
jgi:hypothetical protein